MIAVESTIAGASQAVVRPPVAIGQDDLDRILAVYETGRYLSAFEAARRFGPLQSWAGTGARVLAGRMAANLGAPRLASYLHTRAWRGDPTDPEACYYRARSVLASRGARYAWEFLKRAGTLDDAPDALRADWFAAHAVVLGQLRDFDAAEAWLTRAEAARPEWAWVQVERATLCELEDRYEDALAAARYALELHPWYRPAVQTAAQLLQLLDRDREALELLNEADARLESSGVVAQCALLQSELGQHHDARRSYDRFAALSPLMEPEVASWLAGRRSDTAYDCGDVPAAISFAREAASPFFLALADRLEAAGAAAQRVVLEVPFVRQHHQTCAPATLAALGRYWKKSVDHREVAETICYDGTPDHRERSWAEQNGWVAREFTVTWDATVALLDRGVPFTLTTVGPQTAHLQAVIGYDAARRTLLVRDPTQPYSGEMFADGFLETQRSTGPRGMALVPCGEAARLDGLALPEEALYDRLHRLQVALHAHDRARAAAAHDELSAAAPGHRLVFRAQCELANYDADPVALLAALGSLLERYPEDVNLRMAQLSTLRQLARRDERLDLLRGLCGRTGTDPLFYRQYAQELMGDAREHAAALGLVRRSLRARPLDAASLSLLADLTWDEHRWEEAFELRRFATCLDDKDEALAWSYFLAARHLRREEEALRLLQGRFQRFGARSCQPARTLYWAYAQLERMVEAFAVLDAAARLRPDDGALLLFIAEAHGAHGEFDRAAERLARAESCCRRAAWLRAAAKLEAARGNRAQALGHWQSVLEAEPAALDANNAVARLLAETEGPAAANEHLARSCARFPHNHALHRARLEWLREEPGGVTEQAVRQLLEIHPADAWARRELALLLGRQGRHDEAFSELELAHKLEPQNSSEASVRGELLARAGRHAEAQEAYREAVRRSADNDYAIGRLIDSQDSPAECREAILFVESELERQVTFGDGLLTYARHARGTLAPEELLATLRKAWQARPDLWHAWSALVRELARVERHDEALDLARQAAERFPLLPRIWLDLAFIHQGRGDRAGETEALHHALKLSPGWGAAARQLAQALERDGNYAESRAVLERAVAQAPLDAFNHGCLSDALWHLDEKPAALQRLKHALHLEPEYDWAWSTLHDWSRALGCPEAPVELARALTALRGGAAGTWLRLARTLGGPDCLDARLAAREGGGGRAPGAGGPRGLVVGPPAVYRAIERDPGLVDAHDLKAALLAEAGRFDEAEAACLVPAGSDRVPFTLRGRAAWVAARRGDRAGAIAQMRPIVDAHPNYYWGRRHLAEWLCDNEAWDAYREEAEALVRLAPDDPVASAYRGEARLKLGNRSGAADDFRRALELAPDYGFAAFNLFDIELANEDLAAAGRTLEILKAKVGGEYVLARAVQLAVQLSDKAAAVEALRRLCAGAEGTADWPLRAADKALVQAGWQRLAEETYRDCLDRPEVHPQLGVLWIERCTARRDRRCARRLGALLARGDGEVGRRAMAAYLTELGRAKASWAISACLRRHRAALRADAACWGSAGYALVAVVRHRAAAAWLSDWAERRDARPWMLINLVLALRAQRRVDEANRVSRRALELAPDHTTPQHSVWLALDSVLEGDAQAAAERLGTLDPAAFRATYRYLFHLAQLLVRRAQAGPAERRRVVAETARELAALGRAEALPADSRGPVLATYYRAVRRMARDLGPFTGALWLLGRSLFPPGRRVY